MDTTTTTPRRGGGQPLLHQKGAETQAFGTLKQLPIGLGHDTRMYACQRLNRLLADTQILHSLYKKHHWLMRGATFYSLHLMLDKHADAQLAIVDALAERIQSLGGVPGVDQDPLVRVEEPRQHDGHRLDAVRLSGEGDEGSADLLVSDVIRTGEAQVWFLAEHLVDTPLVRG